MGNFDPGGPLSYKD